MPEALGTAFEFVVNNAVDLIGIVTGNAVLCLGIAIWAAGAAIGLFKRLVWCCSYYLERRYYNA